MNLVAKDLIGLVANVRARRDQNRLLVIALAADVLLWVCLFGALARAIPTN